MKPFTTIAIVFLSLIAILQLTRFVRGWEVMINGVSIPLWAQRPRLRHRGRPRRDALA